MESFAVFPCSDAAFGPYLPGRAALLYLVVKLRSVTVTLALYLSQFAYDFRIRGLYIVTRRTGYHGRRAEEVKR